VVDVTVNAAHAGCSALTARSSITHRRDDRDKSGNAFMGDVLG
jgi:hypothetical protein